MSDKCHICGSKEITYYRQIRRDGVAVVIARCENGHIPLKGKPFYPISLFDIDSLPPLGASPEKQERQLTWEEQLREDYKKELEQPIKKYPPMPKPKLTGRNTPLPIEDK